MVRAKFAVRSLGQEIGLRLMPQMTESIQALLDWRVANDSLIDSNLDLWQENIGKLLGPAKVVGGVIVAMMVGANLANIAIGALIGTFALLVDDIIKFRNGEGATLVDAASDELREFGSSKRIRDLVKSFKRGKGDATDFLAAQILAAQSTLGPGGFMRSGGEAHLRNFERRGDSTTGSNNQITINVNGSGDPTATGIAVVDQLTEFFRGEFSGVTVAPRT